jgi:DNA-directed RNA polymerase alpha subunit
MNNVSIDELKLPRKILIRTINALKFHNILTIQDLLDTPRSTVQRRIPNLGKVCFDEIERALLLMGYQLKDGKNHDK